MDRSDACAISQLPSGLWITELWQKLWPDDQQEHHHWHAYLEHRSPPEALQERAADEWPDRGACREARDPNADGERPLTRHQFGRAMKCPAKTILKNRQAIGYRNFSMGFKDARQQSKRTLATRVHANRSMADPLRLAPTATATTMFFKCRRAERRTSSAVWRPSVSSSRSRAPVAFGSTNTSNPRMSASRAGKPSIHYLTSFG
jgi:hypothetical protein